MRTNNQLILISLRYQALNYLYALTDEQAVTAKILSARSRQLSGFDLTEEQAVKWIFPHQGAGSEMGMPSPRSRQLTGFMLS